MRGVKGWGGGEAVEVPGAGPRRRLRACEAGKGRGRLRTRDYAIAAMAGLVPLRPLGTSDLADAFGLSRSRMTVLLRRLRAALEGRADG